MSSFESGSYDGDGRKVIHGNGRKFERVLSVGDLVARFTEAFESVFHEVVIDVGLFDVAPAFFLDAHHRVDHVGVVLAVDVFDVVAVDFTGEGFHFEEIGY